MYLKTFLLPFLTFLSGVLASQSLPQIAWEGKDSIITIYCQLDYPVKIDLRQADPSMIQLKSRGASLAKLSDSVYQIRFQIPEEEVKLKLYYKNLPVDIVSLNVINMEMPSIRFNGINGNNIQRSDLSKVRAFELLFPSISAIAPGLEFYTCKLTIIEPGKPAPFYINLRSVELPAQLLGIISTLQPESTIIFDELKIKTRSNNVLSMDGTPVKFRVIE